MKRKYHVCKEGRCKENKKSLVKIPTHPCIAMENMLKDLKDVEEDVEDILFGFVSFPVRVCGSCLSFFMFVQTLTFFRTW